MLQMQQTEPAAAHGSMFIGVGNAGELFRISISCSVLFVSTIDAAQNEALSSKNS
jgi:hypothetical protein